jgi:hypothetical protein
MKKIRKFLIWILSVFLIVFLLLRFGSQPILKRILDNKLEKTRVAGLYEVKVKNAYFDLLNFGISLKNVELIPDSSTEAFEITTQIAYLQVNKISLGYLDVWSLIRKNEIHTGKLKIIEPSLDLYLLDRQKVEKIVDSVDLKKESKTNFSLDALLIDDMEFELYMKGKSKLNFERLDLEIDGIVFDPSLLPDISKALEFSTIDLELKRIVAQNDRALYAFKIDEIDIKNHLDEINILGISIKPKYDKEAFAKKFEYQIDRFDIELQRLQILNLNIDRFFNDSIIAIEDINIEGLEMEVYRDKNHPFDFNNFPKLPQQQIRGIKQAIEIEKINIVNTQVHYLELVENAKEAGFVNFKDLHAEIENFGNTKAWQEDRSLTLKAQARIYGNSALSAQMDFPLGSNTFYVSGQIGKSDMAIFNSIVVPNARAKIEEGTIDRLDFNFKATPDSSFGEMNFLYHGLKVDILKEKKDGEIKDRKTVNFLLNNLLLPKQNPNKKENDYKGVISLNRDVNKGFFNYLWKSVFSGIKDTFLKDHKKTQSYKKEEAEQKKTKKELRKAKKEERKKGRKNQKD